MSKSSRVKFKSIHDYNNYLGKLQQRAVNDEVINFNPFLLRADCYKDIKITI